MPLLASVLATNLVFQAVLGEIKKMADKEGISLSTNVSEIQRFEQSEEVLSGHVWFTNGWYFSYRPGGMDLIQSPHALINTVKQGLKESKNAVVGVAESIELARAFVRKLGISPEDVFLDLKPQVNEQNGWGGAKWLELTWYNPAMNDTPSANIEISCARGEVTRVFLVHPRFHADPIPEVPGYDKAGNPLQKESGTETAITKSLPTAGLRNDNVRQGLQEIQSWCSRLKLNTLTNASTNEVLNVEWVPFGVSSAKEKTEWACTITFRNNWKFDLLNGKVTGFHAPDSFFFRWDIRVKDYLGDSTLSDTQCASLISTSIALLGFRDLGEWLLNETPEIGTPNVLSGTKICPRWYQWEERRAGAIVRRVNAEIDTGKGELKSLYVYDGYMDQQR